MMSEMKVSEAALLSAGHTGSVCMSNIRRDVYTSVWFVHPSQGGQVSN